MILNWDWPLYNGSQDCAHEGKFRGNGEKGLAVHLRFLPSVTKNGIKMCSFCRQPVVRRSGVEGNALLVRTGPFRAAKMAQPFKARLTTKNLRSSTRSLSKHLPPLGTSNVQIRYHEGTHAGPRGKCPAAEPQAASDSEGHRTGSSSPSRLQAHVPSDSTVALDR